MIPSEPWGLAAAMEMATHTLLPPDPLPCGPPLLLVPPPARVRKPAAVLWFLLVPGSALPSPTSQQQYLCGALETAPRSSFKVLVGVNKARQVLTAQTARGEHGRRSRQPLKFRGCCKQNLLHGQVGFFPLSPGWSKRSRSARDTVLGSCRHPSCPCSHPRDKAPVGYRKGKTQWEMVRAAQACVPAAGGRLCSVPGMRQPGEIVRLGFWLGCLVPFCTLYQLSILL